MTIPHEQPAVPDLVREQAAGQPVRAVWRNEIGGTTWQIGEGVGRDFLKLGPEHPEFDIPAEIQRLDWLAGQLPVPTLVACGMVDEGCWIRTRGLPGSSAVAPANLARAEVVVPALGRGLRRFHDTLAVEECPFDWSVEHRIARLDRPFAMEPPEVRGGDLVVCHGDACNPNFLVDEHGEVCGYVDLGALGVADRHADLAPAVLSLGWNFGPGWEEDFLTAHCGDDWSPDPETLAFHTALWQAG